MPFQTYSTATWRWIVLQNKTDDPEAPIKLWTMVADFEKKWEAEKYVNENGGVTRKVRW